MTYHRSMGQLPSSQSGGSKFLKGGLPPPPPPAGVPVPGPTMPANLFPTNVRWGDVVTVTGPFGGVSQGHIRVKFTGAPWIAPMPLGPFTASVIVPDGAQTGECLIEIDGRRVFGRNCVVTPASTVGGQVMRPREDVDIESWKDFGEKSRMGNYIKTGLGIVLPGTGTPTCPPGYQRYQNKCQSDAVVAAAMKAIQDAARKARLEKEAAAADAAAAEAERQAEEAAERTAAIAAAVAEERKKLLAEREAGCLARRGTWRETPAGFECFIPPPLPVAAPPLSEPQGTTQRIPLALPPGPIEPIPIVAAARRVVDRVAEQARLEAEVMVPSKPDDTKRLLLIGGSIVGALLLFNLMKK